MGPLRYRWRAVGSGLSLSLGIALKLLPDSPRAGLQSCFIPGEVVACEKQMALITPGKSLGIHCCGMLWEPVGAETPWPQDTDLPGAELLLYWVVSITACFSPCLHPIHIPQETVRSTAPHGQTVVLAPHPSHIPTLCCPPPPSTHRGSVAT